MNDATIATKFNSHCIQICLIRPYFEAHFIFTYTTIEEIPYIFKCIAGQQKPLRHYRPTQVIMSEINVAAVLYPKPDKIKEVRI